jgi:hypothetical protein
MKSIVGTVLRRIVKISIRRGLKTGSRLWLITGVATWLLRRISAPSKPTVREEHLRPGETIIITTASEEARGSKTAHES